MYTIQLRRKVLAIRATLELAQQRAYEILSTLQPHASCEIEGLKVVAYGRDDEKLMVMRISHVHDVVA